MEPQHSAPAYPPRATRFHLCLRARYRCDPKRGWHPAMTVDVSRTGVLLRGRELIDVIDVGSQIDIVFRLSQGLSDTSSSAVSCECRVVRIQPAPDDDRDWLIASEIVTYALHREHPPCDAG